MKKLSLNQKMTGLFVAFAIGSIVIAGIGLMNIRAMGKSTNEVINVYVARLDTALNVQSKYRLVAYSHLRYLQVDTKEELDKYKNRVDDLMKNIEADIDKGISMASETATPWWKEGKEKHQEMMRVVEVSQQHKMAGDKNKYLEDTENVSAVRGQIDKLLQKIIDLNGKRMDEKSVETEELYQNSMKIVVSLSALMIVVISFLAFIVLRATSKAIQGVIRNLNESAAQVSVAAQQIASSSEELSQSSTEQAASLEETAASVEEMSSMVAKNSENAKSAETTSGHSQRSVDQGKEIIKRMMESMQAINVSSEGMAETVKVIEQIDKKTKVINEIVNKTELLSFNASVEAARAGEHGKGFAVVAEEVGNLARMSGAAAEEIGTLLSESIEKVNQMVATTKKNVEAGTQITHECEEVFEEIVGNVTSVSGMATEISSASQEQSNGIGEITKAMSQLDQMTQQNASTSEECASAAEELSAQAVSLKETVNTLISTINGGEHKATSADEAVSGPVHEKPARTVARKNAKVVPLKGLKTGTPESAPALKKASGDVPSYGSNGFSDV